MNKITKKSSLWVALSDKFSDIGVDNIYNVNKNENYGFIKKSTNNYFLDWVVYSISRLINLFFIKIFRSKTYLNYISYRFLKKIKFLMNILDL